MTCPSIELLTDYVLREALGEELTTEGDAQGLAEVEEHLNECAACAMDVDGIAQLIIGLRNCAKRNENPAMLQKIMRCIESRQQLSDPTGSLGYMERGAINDVESGMSSDELWSGHECNGFTTSHKPVSACDLHDVIRSIGGEDVRKSRYALTELVSSRYAQEGTLFSVLLSYLSAKFLVRGQLKSELGTGSPKVSAFKEQQDDIAVDEAKAWLNHESTRIYELVSSPNRRILIALLEPNDLKTAKMFKAFWYWIDETRHVVCVSARLENNALADAIWHELNHMAQSGFVPGEHTDEQFRESSVAQGEYDGNEEKRNEEDKGARHELFANAQKDVERDEKDIAAEWVTNELPLKSGAGVIIDAGSSCLAVWCRIIIQILRKQFSHLLVYSNSLQLLEEWCKHIHKPGIRGTCVEMIGSLLDAEHLAFYSSDAYGKEVSGKLMSEGFRAMNVYIGTSGIEFQNGRLFFGYHAEERERIVKELLFKCYAQRRIILATPRKIGNVSGRAFNVLELDGLNRAPIFIVTTVPKRGSVEEMHYRRQLAEFQSGETARALEKKGVEIHWLAVDRENGAAPKLAERFIAPKEMNRSAGCQFVR